MLKQTVEFVLTTLLNTVTQSQSILVLSLHNTSPCPTTTDLPPQATECPRLLHWTPPTTRHPTRDPPSISTEVSLQQPSHLYQETFQDTRRTSTCWWSSGKLLSSFLSSWLWWPSSTWSSTAVFHFLVEINPRSGIFLFYWSKNPPASLFLAVVTFQINF